MTSRLQQLPIDRHFLKMYAQKLQNAEYSALLYYIEVHTSLSCTIFSHLKYRAADLIIS